MKLLYYKTIRCTDSSSRQGILKTTWLFNNSKMLGDCVFDDCTTNPLGHFYPGLC